MLFKLIAMEKSIEYQISLLIPSWAQLTAGGCAGPAHPSACHRAVWQYWHLATVGVSLVIGAGLVRGLPSLFLTDLQ